MTVTAQTAGKAGPAGEGHSIVEVVLATVVGVVLLLALYTTARLTFDSRRIADRKYHRARQAADYLGRLQELPFGSPADPPPTAAQLTELFDDDDDLGEITLSQLRVAAAAAGHHFELVHRGTLTPWRIKVSADLDGDGTATGWREDRDDLLRIAIWANGRLALQTLRAAEAGTSSHRAAGPPR